MAYKIDPKYRELATTVRTYIMGAYDSNFVAQEGMAMATALTNHQLKLMEGCADEAMLVAVRGYVRVRKQHIKVKGTLARLRTRRKH